MQININENKIPQHIFLFRNFLYNGSLYTKHNYTIYIDIKNHLLYTYNKIISFLDYACKIGLAPHFQFKFNFMHTFYCKLIQKFRT